MACSFPLKLNTLNTQRIIYATFRSYFWPRYFKVSVRCICHRRQGACPLAVYLGFKCLIVLIDVHWNSPPLPSPQTSKVQPIYSLFLLCVYVFVGISIHQDSFVLLVMERVCLEQYVVDLAHFHLEDEQWLVRVERLCGADDGGIGERCDAINFSV